MKIVARAIATIILIAAVFCSCTKEDKAEGDGIINGHTYVDLGLPSGTLWAACNVGADTPEDYGYYFAWGETTPKTTYDWNTYIYCNGNSSTLTKYCNKSSYGNNGFSDHLITLLPEDDAATVNWGNGWRMPTKEECEELINNTSVTWAIRKGVYGRIFSATNGASIFLPAAGGCTETNLTLDGSHGSCWSSSLYLDVPGRAWYLYSDVDKYGMNGWYRLAGRSVRAVHSAIQN